MNYNLLTCGPFGKELAELVNAEYPDFATARFTENVTQPDLIGINALAGFYQFDGLDLKSIRWIHAFGAGVDDYVRHPAIATDLILTRTLGFMDKRIGEYCLAYILEDLKQVIATHDNQRGKVWHRTNLEVLYNKEVLVFGTGSIGQGVASGLAPLAKKVTGVSQSGSLRPHFHEVVTMASLEETLSQHLVVNALPYTAATHHYFDRLFFRKLNGAFFINVGRGKCLVEDDLLQAIEAGHVRKAVLDVFQNEPLPVSSPLWDHPKVRITPHHSGLTTFDDIQKSFADCVKALKTGTKNELFVNLKKGY